jgi:hypothetical protein
MYQPEDVSAGEHDYDPYAFDVACMGCIFATEFDVSLIPVEGTIGLLTDIMMTVLSSINTDACTAL